VIFSHPHYIWSDLNWMHKNRIWTYSLNVAEWMEMWLQIYIQPGKYKSQQKKTQTRAKYSKIKTMKEIERIEELTKWVNLAFLSYCWEA